MRTSGQAAAPPLGDKYQPRPLEQPEVLFTAIFIPIAAFSLAGMILAEMGAFSGAGVLGGGTILSAMALAFFRRELRAPDLTVVPVSRRTWLALGLGIALSALLYSRPGNYLIEGADASVYVATGRHIQRTGSISSADPLVALMPQELRPSFFIVGRPGRMQEARLPGGLPIAPDGTVKPNFFHLLPVWIAIATAAAGSPAGYYVNVVFAALGIVAAGLIGRRLWSPRAGFVAAALLLVNFGQIYHARLPSSEMIAQFLVLSGILFTAIALDLRARVAGACAGMAVGLAAFARVDALLLIVPLAALLLALTWRSQSFGRAGPWFAATLAIVSGHAAFHGLTVSEIYTWRLLSDGWIRVARVWNQLGPMALLMMAGAIIALAILAARLGRRSITWAALPAAIVLVLISPPVIVMLGRLISPPGLVAAAGGLGVLLTRQLETRFLLFIALLLAQGVLLLAWSAASVLPEDFRRAVPILLPSAMLLIGFLVHHVSEFRTAAGRLVWLLPAGLAAAFVLDSAPILRTPPMQGVDAQIAELASHIPAKALVVTDVSVPGHLAMALQYSFDRPTVRLAQRPGTDDGIAPLVAAAFASERQVFVAVSPLVDDKPNRVQRRDFANFDIRMEAAMTLRYEVVAPAADAFPRLIRLDEVPVTLYRVEPRDRESRAALPLVIEVGGEDFGPPVSGFHPSEAFQSMHGRWTNGESRIALPRLVTAQAGAMTLVLRLSAARPTGFAPVAVQITLDGVPAGTIPNVTPDVREYLVPLSAAIQERLTAGPTMLSIVSDVFVPKAVGMGDDGRRLGIVLDWLRVE